MKRKYLITFFQNIKLKKNSSIIFENEYLKKLYTDFQLKYYRCSSIENLDQVFTKKINYIFCKKKAQRYLIEIFPILNELNNCKLKKNEWEILIEYFLLISVINIKTRFDTLKKVKDKKNTFIRANNYDFLFENTDIYKKFQFEDKNFNFYINYLISKRLKFQSLKNKKIKKIFFLKKQKKKFLKKIIYFFLYYLINLFKPVLILDGYFGVIRSLQVLFKSKFKILFAGIDYFDFPFRLISHKKNVKYRSKISIKIRDEFDIIFNEFIKNVLPSSFLENFNYFLTANKKKYLNISKIGTALHFAANDNFKFAVLNLKRQNKKSFNLQHGGLMGFRLFDPEDYINQKISDLNLLWHDNLENIGSQYFLHSKYKSKKLENKILLYPCHILLNQELSTLENNNHFYLNQSINLSKLLIEKKKFSLSIKFFNNQNDDFFKNIWRKYFDENVKILESNISSKGSIFRKYDLIIINDFSTAFYELLYHKKPFIVLNSAPNVNFIKKFWKPINDLKKINLWFENEKQLAKYLDKNFENIILNWDKTINLKYYTKLRKTLFARENFNDSLFVKKILEL